MKTRDSMWALLVAAVALGAGCSPSETNEPSDGASGLRITSFAAADDVLDFGGSTTLSWRTAGAATTIVRSGEEILQERSAEPNGLLEVTPSRTQTFELVIRSAAGAEKSATLEVAVRPAILEFETDAQGQVAVGRPVVVRWKTGGATELKLLAAGGYEQAIPAADLLEGSAEVPVPSDGAITLLATSGELEATASLDLDAIEVDHPTIAQFQAAPQKVTAGRGESTELSWVTTGASSLALLANGSPVDLGDRSPAGGTITVEVDETTVFVLEATNLGGTDTEELTVEALPLPLIDSFRALPSRVAAGETFELSWNTTAASVELLQDDTLLDLGTLEATGAVDRQLAADAHFVLRAYNELGAFVDRVLEVTVGEPIVTSFAAAPKIVQPGGAVTLSWTCDGGTTLTIRDPNGDAVPGCGTADPTQVASGSCSFDAPQAFGHLAYTLEVQNELAASTVVATTLLHVVNGPLEELATVEFDRPWVEHDPLAEDGVSIHWTSSKAVRLAIYQLDEAGQRIEPPVLVEDEPARVAAGSVVVDPDTTSTFRAVATNVYDDEQIAHIEVRLLLVEIDDFDAAPLEVLAGDITTLSWTTTRAERVELDYDVSFSFTQGTLPFVELRDRPTANELAIEGFCGQRSGVTNVHACPTLDFGDFIFPMGDKLHDRAKVSVSGGITFDMTSGEAVTTVVEPLPPVALSWDNMLAVLWDYFIADPGRGSKLLYEFGNEGGRDNLIIEWSQVFPRGGRGNCTKSLSFQVVLWEDGSFDYRYGPFGDYLNDSNCTNLSSSVGYYARSSSQSAQVLYGAEPAGGLSGTSYTFTPTEIGVNDSVDVPLSGSRSFTLTAYGAKGSSASRTVEVVAHQLPSFVGLIRVVAPSLEVFQPMVGDPVALIWQTADANAVEVFDADGELVCSRQFTSPENGTCNVTSQIPGPAEFTLRAYGALGSSADRLHTVTFYPRLEVEEFAATPESFEYGTATSTTLTWKTQGALGFTLLEDGVPVDPPVPVESWASGQRTFVLDQSRTYEIQLSGSDGRSASATQRVEVLAVRPFQATASPAQTAGNQPVTLSWDATLLGNGDTFVSVEPTMPPMQEIPGNFTSIAATGTQVAGFSTADNTAGTTTLDLPFPFPFFGQTYTQVKMGQVGALSFDLNTQMLGGPPAGILSWYNTGSEKSHIVPYLANLRTYSVGKAYTQHFMGARGTGDSFVIEWNQMQLRRDPVPAPGTEADDLTFQVVLFQDGSFEFRYGSMTSPDRQSEAGGISATAGYRKPGIVRQEKGAQIFYNPQNPLVLTNRTWRYQALKGKDSLTVSPNESTIYTICVHHRNHQQCTEVPVAVPAAGDLIVTELQLRPDGGASKQWFELRNLSHVPIDLAGMEFLSAAGTTPIASATPVVVQPGGYITLAASADPGFTPDHVYGSTVLGDGIDGIELRFDGRMVATIDWDESWILPQGKTLSLDPIHHKLNSDAPTHFESFCVDSEAGSPNAGFGCASPYYVVDPYSSRELIDISTTGTRVQQMDGSSYVFYLPGGLGFEMPFFGDRVSNLWASANGFVGFQGTPWVGSVTDPIPTFRGTGLVAGLWTGLLAVGAYWPDDSWFRYQTLEKDGLKVTVLHWEQQRRYTTSGVPENIGDVTIQIQLWENGDIVMIYPSMWGDPMHFGAGATVGIEALDGTTGIQYLFEEASLRKDQAILFEYRQP